MVRSPAEYRVLSRPTEVWWAGFRSTTIQLQQSGWKLAVDEDVRDGRLRLLMHHQHMRLYALSADCRFDYFMRHEAAPVVFEVQHAAHDFQIMRSTIQFSGFRQIDAEPQITTEPIRSIEDLKIFATPLVRTEELIVEPANVAAMLERIREMQVPEQERIRQKERLRQAREAMEGPRQTFHAQIISISEFRKAA